LCTKESCIARIYTEGQILIMASPLAKIAGVSAGTLLLAISYPYLANQVSPALVSLVPDLPLSIPLFKPSREDFQAPQDFVCDPTHTFKTSLVSLDPLVIYIQSLLTPAEISALLATAEPAFNPSEVVKDGRELRTADRTSSSAGLPRNDPAVMCVLERARSFMGTMMRDDWDEMGPVQLVRYTTGQRFNIHHDWYDTPRWANDNSMRTWNRIASFFAVLQDNCTGGETHFPYIRGIVPSSPWGEAVWAGEDDNTSDGEEEENHEERKTSPLWREHEDGGLAFRPVAGNAIFWVNLHANGTGDRRVMHAGLPLESGLKTAMNIWPRQYYASES
jgi:prolyl 4-hydroxylase